MSVINIKQTKVSLLTSLVFFGLAQNAMATSTVVTDAAGEQELWTFQEILGSQKLVSKINQFDKKGIVQVWDENNGNLLTRTDAEGRTTKYTYNVTNQRETMTEAFGTPQAQLTTYEYVSPDIDLIKKTISPSVYASNVKEVVNTYDDKLNITAVAVTGFDAQGAIVTRTTTFTHDQYGKITSIDGPRPETDVLDITTLKYYNCPKGSECEQLEDECSADAACVETETECTTGGECGQLKSITNAVGHVTTYDEYDAVARLKQSTDANGVVTVYTYHPRGWVLSMTQTPAIGSARITTYGYDNVGQLIKTTLPDGSEQNYEYDAAHDLRAMFDTLGNRVEYKYDSRGNRTETLIKDPDGTLVRSTVTSYDRRNFVKSINSGGSVTQLINDAVGNLSEYKDPNTTDPQASPTGSNQFDALNRIDNVVDALTNTSGYAYNVADQLSEVTAPNGAVTQYEYDDLGNQTKEISPDRGTLVYSHDDAGNVTSMTDARSITAHYAYDALNRLTSINYVNPNAVAGSASENVSYTYDQGQNCGFSVGRLCQVTDAVGMHVYAYDSWGNALSQTWQNGDTTFALAYQYDNANRLTQIQYPSGLVIDYVRDGIGRVTAVHSPDAERTEIIADQFNYRADGLVTSHRLGNAQVTQRHYDLQGRLTSQEIDNVEIANYVYDANGNVKQKNDSDHQRTFGYDLLNRLENDDRVSGLLSNDWHYTYDANGNRNTQTRDNEPAETLQYSPVSNVLIEDNDILVLSDLSSNITSMPTEAGILELSYNNQNHLATTTKGGVITNYGYNHQRQRLLKAQGVDVSKYVYDLSGRLVATLGSNGVVHEEYVYASEHDASPIYHRLYDDTESNTVEAKQAIAQSELSIANPVNNAGQCEGYQRTEAERGSNNALFIDNNPETVPVSTQVFNIPPPASDISWFLPILSKLRENTYTIPALDLSNPPIVGVGQIFVPIPTEAESNALSYIVDVATTRRSLNNGPDIARRCVQGNQTSVDLNNLPLNGTNIYVRVWSKQVNGDWTYEDHEIETEAKTPATRQVTRSYIVKDHLDTPRFIYDDEKTLTWRWASDGFGHQAANDDANGDGFQVNFNMGFPGQYRDLESGLMYNWNRYYDAETGRYVTSDPIGLAGGLNTYGYVGGNPLAFYDPFGLYATRSEAEVAAQQEIDNCNDVGLLGYLMAGGGYPCKYYTYEIYIDETSCDAVDYQYELIAPSIGVVPWGRKGFKGGNGKHKSTKNGKGRTKKKHEKNHPSRQGNDKKRDGDKGWYQR